MYRCVEVARYEPLAKLIEVADWLHGNKIVDHTQIDSIVHFVVSNMLAVTYVVAKHTVRVGQSHDAVYGVHKMDCFVNVCGTSNRVKPDGIACWVLIERLMAAT